MDGIYSGEGRVRKEGERMVFITRMHGFISVKSEVGTFFNAMMIIYFSIR